MQTKLDISVVVPVFNEDESLPELTEWIDKVMVANGFSYEVVMVDDGSTDNSWEVINQICAKNKSLKGMRLRRNYGKSAALNVAFEAVTGEVVITMDADLQDSPDEIPGLYSMIVNEKYDLVSGWKKKRYDPISKTVPTKLFNWATRKMSGIYLHDFNCGLKAYRQAVVKNVEVYGEMHRYIPVIAKWAGFTRIGEKEVEHRARKYGTTKFGMERFINGFLDLMSITFVSRFGKKPMHFFGLLGVMFFFTGFVIATYLSVSKLLFAEYKMTERPLFYLGILSMIIGTQLFLTGFISEMVARSSPDKNTYQIDQTIN